jgi:hypothetical protein
MSNEKSEKFKRVLSGFHSMKMRLGKDLFAEKPTVALTHGQITLRLLDLQLESGRMNLFANAAFVENGSKKIILRLRAPLHDYYDQPVEHIEIDIGLPISEIDKLCTLKAKHTCGS